MAPGFVVAGGFWEPGPRMRMYALIAPGFVSEGGVGRGAGSCVRPRGGPTRKRNQPGNLGHRGLPGGTCGYGLRFSHRWRGALSFTQIRRWPLVGVFHHRFERSPGRERHVKFMDLSFHGALKTPH